VNLVVSTAGISRLQKKTKKLVFQVKKKTIKQKSAYVPTPYGQDAAGNLVDCHVGCGVE
jgi:hypothetical protein